MLDCDVCVLVPLREEFRTFNRVFETEFEDEYDGLHYYTVETESSQDVLAILFNDIGRVSAAQLTERVLSHLQPEEPDLVALIGIAGALSDDIKLGDVVVADEVNSYQTRSKAIELENEDGADQNGGESNTGYEINYGGNHWRVNYRVRSFASNFEFSYPEQINNWHEDVANYRGQENIPVANSLRRSDPVYKLGHIASGDTVITSTSYAEQLLSLDRNLLAIEMESAGVFKATSWRNNTNTLVLRGISDFSDKRKDKLDDTDDAIWRDYGMYSATRYFKSLLDAGITNHLTSESVRKDALDTDSSLEIPVEPALTEFDIKCSSDSIRTTYENEDVQTDIKQSVTFELRSIYPMRVKQAKVTDLGSIANEASWNVQINPSTEQPEEREPLDPKVNNITTVVARGPIQSDATELQTVIEIVLESPSWQNYYTLRINASINYPENTVTIDDLSLIKSSD